MSKSAGIFSGAQEKIETVSKRSNSFFIGMKCFSKAVKIENIRQRRMFSKCYFKSDYQSNLYVTPARP